MTQMGSDVTADPHEQIFPEQKQQQQQPTGLRNRKRKISNLEPELQSDINTEASLPKGPSTDPKVPKSSVNWSFLTFGLKNPIIGVKEYFQNRGLKKNISGDGPIRPRMQNEATTELSNQQHQHKYGVPSDQMFENPKMSDNPDWQSFKQTLVPTAVSMIASAGMGLIL